MKSTSAAFILVFANLIFLTGCADTITFSKDAREHGVTLYSQQQYADAAGSFRNATKQNPSDYGSYYMLGCCYEQMGQHQIAINAFRTSLDVQATTQEGKEDDDQRLKTIVGLAKSIARSDTRDVETNATVSRATATQRPEDYMVLAEIYANRGDPDSAIEAFDHASLLAPEAFYISKTYGLYLEKLGQKNRAEAALRRAYAIYQFDEQVNLALRRCGVVPGPSLKPKDKLTRPPLPYGPLPELDFSKVGPSPADNATKASSTQPPAAGSTASAPRD